MTEAWHESFSERLDDDYAQQCRPARRWHMYAHRYDNGDLHNLGDRRYTKAHSVSKPIVEVDVAKVAEDNPAAAQDETTEGNA